jgi:hypothetical protein
MFSRMAVSCSIFSHIADTILKVNEVKRERDRFCRTQDENKGNGAVKYERDNFS